MTLRHSGRAMYLWLVLALVAGVGGFASYASIQYGRLNDLNQRQLSNATTELKTALLTAVETLTRFNDKRVKWEKEREANPAAREPNVCEFDKNQPYLEWSACASDETSVPKETTFKAIQPVTSPTLGINVIDAMGNVAVPFKFRADTVLQELAFPDSFALILIASETGEILYQDAPARRGWLRHLRWGERELHADRPPSLHVQNLKQVLGGSEDTWNQLRAVSSRTAVQLGGTAHQLYLQPLVVEHGQRTHLVVGGAVPQKTIVTDALMLDTSSVGVLGFLVLLGVLGFPFIKLISLAPNERFRLRDVHLLHTSAGALLVLLTCGSLALDGSIRWSKVADAGLQTLATDLEHRFLKEVTDIRDRVVAYDEAVGRMSVHDCKEWPVRTEWFSENKLPEGSRIASEVPPNDWLPWPNDVHIRQVVWIRPDGWQAWKVTADEIPGKSLINRQRSYFHAVQVDHLFQAGDSDRRFFLGPDRSNADGKFYTYLSIPSTSLPSVCPGAGRGSVVSATAQLLSLDKQPLPAGYGFALFNREGRVLYHSDGRLSLREDLFEELSEGARLRSMVYAGWEGLLESRYRERPHHLYVRPIGLRRADTQDSAGFFIVAFRDTSAEQALVGRAFVTALVVPVAMLIVVYVAGLGGLCLLSRVRGRHWSAWLWPHAGLDHVYLRQTIMFVGLLLASAAFYLSSGSAVGFLVVPLAAAVLGLAIYVSGSSETTVSSRLSVSRWQTSSVMLAVVCLVVAPSTALFRLTLGNEFAKLILTEQRWIESQKADMRQAPDVETLTDDYAQDRIARLKQLRQQYFGCVPAPFDALDPDLARDVPPHTGQTEVQVQRAVHLQDQSSPGAPVSDGGAFGECANQSGDSYRDGAAVLQSIGSAGAALSMLHASDRVLTLGNDILARQAYQRGGLSYSLEGGRGGLLRMSVASALGLALTLALLFWWIRWKTTHVFLADYEPTGSPASAPIDEAWSACSADEQMVLLQVARERIANPRQRETVTRLLDKGLLQINPELRPASEALRIFLQQKEEELAAQIREWERVKNGASWHYVRLILIACLAFLTIFLFATQPTLPTHLAGIATSITGAVTAALKLRETIKVPGKATPV